MEQLTDDELFLQIQGASYPAFEELYLRHFKFLFQLAYKKTGDKDEAADLIQEVFLNFWDKRETTVINIPVRNYLRTSLIYKLSNYFRVRGFQDKHIKNFELFLQQPISTEKFLDVWELGKSEQEYNEILELIYHTIDKMPDSMKAIFQLSRSEKYSVKEIAEILGLSPQTVKNQVSRAFSRIRQAMGDKQVTALKIAIFVWLTIN